MLLLKRLNEAYSQATCQPVKPLVRARLRMAVNKPQWFAGAYTLAVAATLPLAGLIGDHGHSKRVLSLSLGGFTIANASVLLISTSWHLIILRVFQGIFSAFILALAIALVARTFQGNDRTKALSLAALTSTIGIPLGPFLGGTIIAFLDFRWVFVVNIPFAIAALFGVLFLTPKDHDCRPLRTGMFPYVFGFGLLALTWGTVKAGRELNFLSGSAILAGTGIIVLGILVALRGKTTVLPQSVLKLSSFRHGAMAIFVTATIMIAVIFIAPQYFAFIWAWRPLQIALGLTPAIISLVIGTRLAVPLNNLLKTRIIFTLGFVLIFTGCLLFSLMGDAPNWAVLTTWSFPLGLGLGILLPLAMDLSLKEVDSRNFGSASAAIQATRQVGGTLGVAIFGSLVNAASFFHIWRLIHSLPQVRLD